MIDTKARGAEEWRLIKIKKEAILTFGNGELQFGFPINQVAVLELLLIAINASLAAHNSATAKLPQLPLESEAEEFWKRMFIRQRCGCFQKDCVIHGSWVADEINRVEDSLSETLIPKDL